MKLVVGLGNPGRRYARTRHNVGFRVVERAAERARIALGEHRWEARLGRGRIGGAAVVLLLPQSYMNASGDSVANAVRELPVEEVASDVLVVVDDADLPLGRLRLRAGGGHGGHRGLCDVLARLGRKDLPRLRFGIGRPDHPMDTVDYVLEPFGADEEPVVRDAVERAAEAVECFVAEGIVTAMNRHNPSRAAP